MCRKPPLCVCVCMCVCVCVCVCVCMCSVTQLCPTLCNHMNYSLLGSSVHRIFQARILEQVAVSFSRRVPTQGSSLHFRHWQTDSLPLGHQGIPSSLLVLDYTQDAIVQVPGINSLSTLLLQCSKPHRLLAHDTSHSAVLFLVR